MMARAEVPETLDIGKWVRSYRHAKGFSIRGLAKEAGVTASYVSGVEAGRVSPTISTLRKLLVAMGTDLGEFFTEGAARNGELVYRRETMQTVRDETRRYVFMLPRRPDIQVEVVDETVMPGEQPEFETLTSDLAGFVLEGELLLEVEGEEQQQVRVDDAFYVPSGRPVRGRSTSDESPVRLVTIYVPPRY